LRSENFSFFWDLLNSSRPLLQDGCSWKYGLSASICNNYSNVWKYDSAEKSDPSIWAWKYDGENEAGCT
jgi:hypothetical protein